YKNGQFISNVERGLCNVPLKMMKKIISISFLLIAYSPAWGGLRSSAPIGCESTQGSTKKILLESSIVLNKKFIPSNEKNFVSVSIEKQIQHFLGYLKNTKYQNLNTALLAYRGPIKFKVSSGTYGLDLDIDEYLPLDRYKNSDHYILNAMRDGLTKKSQKALIIKYTVELMIADCSPKSVLENTPIVLPLDPFLSMWVGKKEDRSKRAIGPFILPQVSNCNTSNMVIFGGPEVGWYFWSPLNGEGKACAERGVVTPKISVIAEMPKSPALSKKFFQTKGPLKFSAIFGEVDSSDFYTPKNIEVIKDFVEKNLLGCMKDLSQKCMESWTSYLVLQKDGKFLEPGIHSFLSFLKYLNSSVEMTSFKKNSTHNLEEMNFVIAGKLKSSRKEIEIQVFFGKTNLDFQSRPSKSYLLFTHEAFKEADIISYVGHAGLGKNMLTTELSKRWEVQKIPPIKRDKPIWLGVYNCEAASYFGFDLNLLFKSKSMKVLETLTSGSNSGAEFPLFHLSALDALFTHGNVNLGEYLKLNPDYPNEFVVQNLLEE
ncbi:MAG: hypothetical protein K2Q18_00370, partial [Bdellovibrionales bacterium]|nr:hypothetical protein [Bdellovibrionales bacterium]